MTRYLTLATLMLFAAAAGFSQGGAQKDKDKDKDKDVKVEGTLSKDDPKDPQRGGPSQVHAVRMKAGKVYTIDMVSNQLDSYLRLQDAKGAELAEDDDSGGNLNARIIFNCPADGEYKVVTTTFGGDMKGGMFTLTVKVTGAAVAPSSAHGKMVGKDAPEFTSDFAVNGKPGKLSKFAGKVVVLYFFDLRSGESTAYLPKFADWTKAYKDKGLTVAGVTFYASDINQKLGFDPDEGKLTTVAEADKNSDQAVLKAFAAHHKVDHPLMVLSKQAAFEAYDAYGVNGVPQVVLIDRKGVVRLIDLNGEKGSALVESEFKKLLAEK